MRSHREFHKGSRAGWLRAGVLGANDGLISTASLLMGVSAANLSEQVILTTGFAGLVAGALSMAAGEYVSVSSQADSEQADLARERGELATAPEAEHRELVGIYVERGLSRDTAEVVAREMAAHDALGAHARDELGITDLSRARPLQAALVSMVSFAVGAGVPLALIGLLPATHRVTVLVVVTLALLMTLGAVGARLGGARITRAALRVGVWGMAAMGATALIGRLFGVDA